MIKSVLLHPISAILITIVAVLTIISMRQSLEPITDAEQGLYRLEQEKQRLQEEIVAEKQKLEAASQPFYQEKKLRDELLLQKPDEIVIMMPEVTPIPRTPSPTPKIASPWEEWQQVLF